MQQKNLEKCFEVDCFVRYGIMEAIAQKKGVHSCADETEVPKRSGNRFGLQD